MALVVSLGIFAGTGFEVKAAGGLEFVNFTPPDSYSKLSTMCIPRKDMTSNEMIQISQKSNFPTNAIVVASSGDTYVTIYDTTGIKATEVTMNAYSDYANFLKDNKDTTWYIAQRNENPTVPGKFVAITEEAIDKLEEFAPNAPYSVADDINASDNYLKDAVYVMGCWNGSVLYARKGEPTQVESLADVKPILKQALNDKKQVYIWVSDKPATSDTVSQGDHTHSYSWETVQEATIWQDEIEEYRCSCGDVQERSVIPASASIADGFCNAVGNAPLNGIAEYDSAWWYTMSDYFIRELAKRPDVTTVVTFKYQNQYYKMTIPAGIDYTQLLTDEEYFYGYFYFAGLTGARIEAVSL